MFLDLRLLGTMEVRVDGSPVATPEGRPARALLAWLALNPGIHTRDRVADELWPGGLVKAQRDSLKTALAKLRRALPDDAVDQCLVARRTELGIREGTVSTDVAQIGAHMETGDLQGAVALMRGDLLPGIDADWADDLRRAHRSRESSVLTSLAEDAVRRGDHARAAELTRRRLRLDPLDEDASVQLMQHLVAERRTRGALDEYDRLVRAHRRAGLVYEPSVAVQRLMTTLRSRTASVQRPSAGARGGGDSLEALHAYRWDAYLRAPADDDPHPDYAVESIRIAYRATRLPEILRVACVAGEDDDPSHALTSDRGYWFRWSVDASLDPSNEAVFATDALLVNGRSVPCDSVAPLEADAGRGVAHLFRVPELDESRLHSVDLLARSRVYVGGDRRVHTEAVARRPVTDAEFRLTVSESLRASKVTVGTSSITALSDEGTPICGPLFAPSGGVTGALARFSYPLQQGSGVSFEIVREVAGGEQALSQHRARMAV